MFIFTCQRLWLAWICTTTSLAAFPALWGNFPIFHSCKPPILRALISHHGCSRIVRNWSILELLNNSINILGDELVKRMCNKRDGEGFCLRCHAIEALLVQNSNNMWGNYQVFFAFLQTIVRGTTIYLVDWLIISILLSSWLLNLVFIDTSHHLVGGF